MDQRELLSADSRKFGEVPDDLSALIPFPLGVYKALQASQGVRIAVRPGVGSLEFTHYKHSDEDR